MKVVAIMNMTEIDYKLQYLAKLVWTYRRFSKHFNAVEVSADTNEVMVKWYDPLTMYDLIHDFEAVTFPLTDLDKRIVYYRNALKAAYRVRNEETIIKFKR